MLDIKVFLEGIKGKVEITDKIRGKKRFLKKAIDLNVSRAYESYEKILFY